MRVLVPETARRVLDVGCGAGALGGALRAERGIEVVGVERLGHVDAATAAARLDDVIDAELETLAELPYPSAHFDAIVLSDVLERVRDPHRLLRALRPYLAADGAIVCSIANVKHWAVVMPLLVHDRWSYEETGPLDPTRVRCFTLAEIEAMLDETGFDAYALRAVVVEMPSELHSLAEAAATLGAEREETVARLNAYQYVVAARPAQEWAGAPAPVAATGGPEQPAERAAHATAAISLLVTLDGDTDAAIRSITSIAELDPHQPAHDVVVVHDGSPSLEPLLASLDGDVTLVRADGPTALSSGLERCDGERVVVLPGAPAVPPRFLAPLVAALDDEGVAAASAGDDSPIATRALAFRRDDVQLPLPAAPAGLELASLCVQLAGRGELRPVPASRFAAEETGQMRRVPEAGEIELSIVIPTLDAAGERTRNCIRAVQARTAVDHEIVVIDNGAPPQGFTAPVNAGLRAARGRYLLVLNDDVELLPGWWEPLRDALDGGAAVVFPETIDQRTRPDFAAWCFALSRATLERFAVAEGEFLDPDLVVWFQDTDLRERLRLAGVPPVHVPRSRIRHLASATVQSDEPELRAWVAERVKLDQEAFEAKHGTDVYGAAR